MPQSNFANVVRQPSEFADTAAQQPRRMQHQFFIGQSADPGVTPDLGAAGQDQAARAFFITQCMLGALQWQHIAIHQFAFAAATTASLTAMAEGLAATQQRVENSLAFFGRNRRQRYLAVIGKQMYGQAHEGA
jgi:hypothetical protein